MIVGIVLGIITARWLKAEAPPPYHRLINRLWLQTPQCANITLSIAWQQLLIDRLTEQLVELQGIAIPDETPNPWEVIPGGRHVDA